MFCGRSAGPLSPLAPPGRELARPPAAVAAWPWGSAAPAGRVGRIDSALPARGHRAAPAHHSPHRRRDRQAGDGPLRTGPHSRWRSPRMRRARFTAAIAPQSASPLKPLLPGAAVQGQGRATSVLQGQAKSPADRAAARTSPSRVLTVTGIRTAPLPPPRRWASSGSRSRPLPAPFAGDLAHRAAHV